MRRRPFLHTLPLIGTLGPLGPATQASPGAPGRRVLRLAFETPETALDPVQTQSDRNSNTVLAQILESPLCYDYLARPARLLPNTAEALPQMSADGRVFTVRIKPGILFSDDPAFGGRPRELVAADYVYAIKRFYDPRWNSSDLYMYESLKLPGLSELRQQAMQSRRPFDYDREVEGLRAPDRYTLRITLGVPDPRFVYLFADAVMMGAVAREVVERYGDDIGAHPVGTGAFRLRQWRRASRIVLERSPTFRRVHYEGTPADTPEARAAAAHLAGRTLPLADELVFDVAEEAQPRWLSFLDGTYHMLEVPPSFLPMAAPGGELAPYLARAGIRMQRQLRPDMSMNFFFMEDPLVGGYTPEKVALRRAVALAFDSPTYRRNLLSGFGIPAQSTVAPHTSGYDPAYKSEMSDFDPARARALLDTYGYTDRNGDGWREQPDGQPLVLRMSSLATLSDRRRNEVWKRSMDAVGLRMVFEPATWPELLKRSRAGTLMMWGYGWTAGSPDGGFFLGIAYGPNASEANDPRFALPAFDRLFERQRVLPDGPEREALMHQAKNLLVAYMPFKVLVHHERVDLVQPATRAFWRHPFMRDIWRFVDVVPGGAADG
ncbi:ABC transporter substrate-binding protein [Pseudorhodoferax sp.]|uniref:ABC transporter substrate-binding protein n=1 Tax=Pseudorhodoferax sp. TaxID=1993553 RepID=UPI002DD65907|nr:ABC transporter substrate-binding protein [Pseudorhodoferax sp.]